MRPYFFGNTPPQGKGFLLKSSATVIALLLFSALSVLNYIYTMKEVMVEKMDTVSKSIAEQSIPELRLRGMSQPDMALLALCRNDPDIEAAIIYDTDKVSFLTYFNPKNEASLVLPDSFSTMSERFIFLNGKLKFQVLYPILFRGKSLGTLYILSNTDKFISHFEKFLFLMALSFVVSLGVALFTTSRLQKQKSKPVVLLAHSAREISEQKVALHERQRIEKMLSKFDDALAATEEKLDALAERHMMLSPGNDDSAGNVTNSFSPSRAENVPLVGKVLLVDDESINRTVLATVLEKLGLEVEVAQSGTEALQMIEANDFLLVLMDIHMPEMSGFEVTKKIRILEQESDRKRVAILAMTADDEETSRQQCFEVGMDDFLTKPIKPEILLERIVTLLATDKTNNILPSALSEQEIAQNTLGQELWSRTQAIALVGGDEALFYELATVFLGRNDLLLQNIEVAIERGKADDLLEAAHAYKGAIGYFACQTLRRLAIALENLARTGRVEGGDVHLAQLRDNSKVLCSDLSQLVLETERSC